MRQLSQSQEAESAPCPELPAPAAVTHADPPADAHLATRDRVARSILDHGPSSTADLATRLGLTTAAVRRHLDGLAASGLVESREQRVYGHRGRGRPAKVFVLTDPGRDAFYQAYDQLAADALHWIADSVGGGEAGEKAVAAFARARFGRQAERYGVLLAKTPVGERTQVLAKVLSEDGYAATVRRVPSAAKAASAPAGQTLQTFQSGEQLCQHHCPVAHIAEQFPQLCEAETEVFSKLLGTHVQRLATIAHGDGVCTTYVPATGAASSPAPRQAPDAVPTADTALESNTTSSRRNSS